jgi:hypothetical protein
MKKLLLMAGVLALAACGEKKAEAPAGETTGEMAPAAADSATMAAPADTGMAHSDSTMARDSAAH